MRYPSKNVGITYSSHQKMPDMNQTFFLIKIAYSTVTALARLRGLSTSSPR